MMTMTNLRSDPKIIDKINLNNYGVILFHTKDLEQFQEDSGFVGEYRTEYQMHYYAAVGRMESDGQILDIAIPLLMYNYPQRVSGAHIGFHLDDVNDAADEWENDAVENFKKFQKTNFFKYIVEKMGITDWTITRYNNIHVHPGSGATYSDWKEITDEDEISSLMNYL